MSIPRVALSKTESGMFSRWTVVKKSPLKRCGLKDWSQEVKFWFISVSMRLLETESLADRSS